MRTFFSMRTFFIAFGLCVLTLALSQCEKPESPVSAFYDAWDMTGINTIGSVKVENSVSMIDTERTFTETGSNFNYSINFTDTSGNYTATGTYDINGEETQNGQTNSYSFENINFFVLSGTYELLEDELVLIDGTDTLTFDLVFNTDDQITLSNSTESVTEFGSETTTIRRNNTIRLERQE